MQFIKKYNTFIFESLYLIFVYFYGQLPLRDYDIWFHLKSGELFVNQGALQFTEVFAHTTYGKEWIPYEWLFQVTVYLISLINISLIPYFIAIFTVLTQFFFLRILSYIFKLPLPTRLVITFLFFVAGFDFNTARPHVLAYSFVVMGLFFILARIYKGKKWIYFTPLVTLIWANLHSTAFLMWGLQITFAAIIVGQWFLQKTIFKHHKQIELRPAAELSILAGVNFICTILPPLGFIDYKLLWTFYQQRDFLGKFIAEWAPTTDILGYNTIGFVLYLSIFLISLVGFLIAVIKKKIWLESMMVIPFIIMAVMGFSAVRNLYLGTVGIILLFAWVMQFVTIVPQKKIKFYIIVALACAITVANAYLLSMKNASINSNRLYYPTITAEFTKKYLKGNIFNDYTYGGYVLYNVYPNLHVFIDGRADVYICCQVMKDYLNLALYKYLPDREYKKFLDSLWKKYDISIVLLPSSKHNVLRRITSLLNDDPNWALVFWDDSSQVFVRRDGKNKTIIDQMEAKYATPYLRNLYRPGKQNEALKEYQRMYEIVKTARTSNALGYIMLEKKQLQQAADLFYEATDLDPTFESPYMNLGELAAKDERIDLAVSFYRQALKLASDRGLIYIRLGELVFKQTGDPAQAREIWQKGVEKTVDEDARKKLQELLNTL